MAITIPLSAIAQVIVFFSLVGIWVVWVALWRKLVGALLDLGVSATLIGAARSDLQPGHLAAIVIVGATFTAFLVVAYLIVRSQLRGGQVRRQQERYASGQAARQRGRQAAARAAAEWRERTEEWDEWPIEPEESRRPTTRRPTGAQNGGQRPAQRHSANSSRARAAGNGGYVVNPRAANPARGARLQQ